ncbi:MAG TPA: prepilin-type N-terminal cleavage/methylation domain-containing protein [Candidatus Ratteibacteria bacterium]|nr:prepilin-type N-terminal cleavage/methylation domain-containing protein [Candidatus Ratteibacteria bacterium]
MKNNGFTLIEILISTVIIFITVSLIYLTYYNLEKETLVIEEKLEAIEIKFNFLTSLKEQLKSAIEKKDTFQFSSDSILFEATSNYSPYTFQYKFYTYQTDKGFDLIEERTNLFTQKKIIIPIAKNYYSFNFEFYDGNNYFDNWDKEKMPFGIRIKISEGENEEFYYYIKLPTKDEKKE